MARVAQSPALVGRGGFLTLAERRLAETAAVTSRPRDQQPRLFRCGPDMLVGPVGARWGGAYA
jgi:hypothetical protein